MNINSLQEKLSSALPDTPVTLRIGDLESQPGFHLTEIKLAGITSLDCGANRRDWREVSLQMLDANGGAPMTAGKLAGILRKGVAALPQITDLPVSIEFSPGNSGLQTLHIDDVRQEDEQAVVSLSPARALCKPAAEAPMQPSLATTGCCGSSHASSTACCG